MPPGNLGDNLINKKHISNIYSNIVLILHSIEWPALDTLWQAIRDLVLEMFIKSWLFFDKYKLVAKYFLAYLFLIVRDLNQD